MIETCPRLLEPKKPEVEGKPEFSIYNACKREKELGGTGYYSCQDCEVVVVRRASVYPRM